MRLSVPSTFYRFLLLKAVRQGFIILAYYGNDIISWSFALLNELKVADWLIKVPIIVTTKDNLIEASIKWLENLLFQFFILTDACTTSCSVFIVLICKLRQVLGTHLVLI